MCGFLFSKGQELNPQKFKIYLERLHHRGPDDTQVLELEDALVGFKRLSIMDLSHAGDQPFGKDGIHLVCNGEIYNYRELKELYPYEYKSESDCEVLIPLYQNESFLSATQKLDGEFALVLFDEKSGEVKAARDAMGIRPLFYGYSKKSGEIAFASEAKALKDFCLDVKPFPPGHIYEKENFISFKNLAKDYQKSNDNEEVVYKKIHDLLEKAVIKRLESDAPIGFLLSGGLDSSLVCSIAAKHSKKPIRTFAIGMSEDAIDLKYAKQVADHIGSDHTEVIITKENVLSCLRDVIYQLETWDITTVRASLGMYLVCQWIKENTDIKVLLTGEVSDELFGYKYTDFAPSAEEFQKEAEKRIHELYMFDVLRADRCIGAHSLDARVPFSDKSFVEYVMSIDPKLKMNFSGHGKYLLRKAFEKDDYLPHSILWREKAAFSDAVGHSLVETIKDYAESMYKDSDIEKAQIKYPYKSPFTKESLLYREIFEDFYRGLAFMVCDYWMPNQNWENCKVSDPSARVLPNYGASGV